MRFFPRSGQLLPFTILPALLCGWCVLPGRGQDRELPQSSPTVSKRMSPADQTGSPSTLPSQVSPSQPFGSVESTIEVRADDRSNLISPAFEGARDEIQSSAGTFGDFSRYLLLLPGVVAKSDSFNDLLVRGGNPSENLYVVDGIEVPNINHFAVGGTTSGFTPMINTSTISKVDLQPGVYDAGYSSRLSSLVEIRTRDLSQSAHASELNVGIAGVGAFTQQSLGDHFNALLAVDRSLLNLATNDAGLDGVPVYTNGMARFEWSPDKRDTISFLSLSGGDSIVVRPCAGDLEETLAIDTQYSGLQSTNGVIWQHTYGPGTASRVMVSSSLQDRDIAQQSQLVDGVYSPATASGGCTPSATTPVYSESTLDRITSFRYNLLHDLHGWQFSLGSMGKMFQLDYAISQPAGAQSPFNPDPTWTDAVNFRRGPATWETGSFVEAYGNIGTRLTARAGLRVETFELNSTHAWEPAAGLGFRIGSHHELRAAYRISAQLPPYIDMLSYPQNRSLPPILAEQLSAGADLWRSDTLTMSLDGYVKNYFKEPISTEYPSLMLANMIYTPGDQFVWLPLKTGGRGKSLGLEFFLHGRLTNRTSGIVSVTYSKTRYRAADGILRPGNYDFPFVGNAMLTFRLPRTYTLSVRDSYTTGRPYTPYNVPLSLAQDRGIYDLSKVNQQRGPAYNRADVSLDHNFYPRLGVLNLYVGLQNIFVRKNFIGYVWLPRCGQDPSCIASFNGLPIQRIDQMPAFPVAGLRWDFSPHNSR